MIESPSLFLDTLSGLWQTMVFPGGLFAGVAGLFFLGLDAKLVARMQRRVGAPLMQPFFDCIKLLLKTPLLPERNKGLFIALPIVAVVLAGICASLVPIAGAAEATVYRDDALFFYCMLLLPSIILMAAGAYFPSTYRAVTLRRDIVTTCAYAVPLALVLYAVAMKAGDGTSLVFSFRDIGIWQQTHGAFLGHISMWPAFGAYLLALPAVMGSAPFSPSDGETESLGNLFEEYSGVLLALFTAAKALRLFAVLGLGVTLFLPGSPSMGWVLGLITFLLKCGVFMVAGLTLIKTAVGSFQVRQVVNFCCKGPVALALGSLIIVWLSL